MEINKYLFKTLLATSILTASFSAKSQSSPENLGASEFQNIAKETILYFQETLNIIQDSFSEPYQITNLIRDTYTNNRDQLFYDSTAMIVDDLEPGKINYTKISAWKYLNQFNRVYKKNNRNTVEFYNIFVGPAEIHEDTVYVTVFFDSKFNGKNKNNNLPHLKVSKKAIIAFYNEDDNWNRYLKSVDALTPNFQFSDDYVTNYFSDKLGIVGDMMERVYNNRVTVNYGSYQQTYYADSSVFLQGEVGECYIPSKDQLRIQYKSDNVLLASNAFQVELKGKSLESFTYSPKGITASSPFFTLQTFDSDYQMSFPKINELRVNAAESVTKLNYKNDKNVTVTDQNTHIEYNTGIPLYIYASLDEVKCGRQDEKTEIAAYNDNVKVNINGFERTFHIDDFRLIANMVLVQGSKYNTSQGDFIDISDFYMDVHEVTLAQFKTFVDSTGYVTDAEKNGFSYVISDPKKWTRPKKVDTESVALDSHYNLTKVDGINWRHDIYGIEWQASGYADFPVVHVSYNDASAFAEWKGKRLPTELEWRYAEAGGILNDVKKHNIANMAQYDKSASEKLQPVKKLRGNELALYDMNGNVFEWIESQNESGLTHVIGGCFLSEKHEVENICIGLFNENQSSSIIGFRCVADFK